MKDSFQLIILHQILLKKYEATLNELASLRYVHDSQAKQTYLSGKIEAFEDVSMMIRTLLSE